MEVAAVVPATTWYCHCCRYKNSGSADKCFVCGRPESYVMTGFPLPLHGSGSQLFRSSQLSTLLTEEALFERDSVQWTALHSASVSGNFSVVRELIRRNCMIDAVTDQGQTALHLAAYRGSLETVQALVENGADVNAVTFAEKMTPLHIVCKRDWKQIAKYLIDRGANVNCLNIIERTPLHFAAENGRADLAVILIKHGAKSNLMDSQGWTARQVAELHNHREFQELLVQVNTKEKQVVIKKLPPAPWHSELWDGVVRIHESVKKKAEREMEITAKLMAAADALKDQLTQKPERLTRMEVLTLKNTPNDMGRGTIASSGSVSVGGRKQLTATGMNTWSDASVSSDISSITRSQSSASARGKLSSKSTMLAAAASRVLAST